MKEVAPKYPDTEGSLYTITTMVCRNCTTDLALFAKQNKKYTLAYVNNILKLSSDAEKMPNQVKRQSQQKTLLNTLKLKNVLCCDNMQALKRYITKDGFAPENIDAMTEMAGDDYYTSASNRDWQDTRTMNTMMTDFVILYPTELAACGMPDDFAEKITEDGVAFENALSDFNESKSLQENATSVKVTANNEVYDAVQGILYDGKYIFRRNATKQKLYTYADLLRKITQKPSGYKVWLTDVKTTKPIEEATIVFVESDVVVNANNKGLMEVELPIRKTPYHFTITAPGYEPMQGEMLVDETVMHRLKIEMKEIMSAEKTV